MAMRILWNRDEAIILLDALIKVLRGEVTRNKAIEDVSKTLREKAINSGMQIDDIFRNTNGISFQMSTLENVFTKGQHGIKKTSKLFEEVVDLYYNQRTKYEELLRQAKVAFKKQSLKDEYFIWLGERISSDKLVEYSLIYNIIEDFCLKRKILQKELLETQDINTIEYIQHIIKTHRSFIYKRNHKKYSMAIKYYLDFLNEEI